jgi:hypothetical protein
MRHGPARRPAQNRLSRAALRLYPPSWRARYAAEVLALLDDAGGGLMAALGLAWRALPAWIWPPRQLHDREALAVTARLLGGPDGVSPAVFFAVTLLGFGAAAASCAGPILAMQRLRPRGPAVQLAAWAASLATAAIVVAGAASATALTGLFLWARGFVGYHSGAVLSGYLAVVAALAMTAIVSARRGARAARSR